MILRWTCAATPGRVRGPATRAAVRGRDGERVPPAQRRPGREPRRHVNVKPLAGRIHGRSTKAGAWNPGDTPGTGWSGPATCSALNEGRGVNPGDTRGGRLPRGRRWSPLNEGRGVNPGDTSSSLRG